MAAKQVTSTSSILTETVGTVLTITRTPKQGAPPTVAYGVRFQYADHLFLVDGAGAKESLLHAGTNPRSAILNPTQVQAMMAAPCKTADGTECTVADLIGDLWDEAIRTCTPTENT